MSLYPITTLGRQDWKTFHKLRPLTRLVYVCQKFKWYCIINYMASWCKQYWHTIPFTCYNCCNWNKCSHYFCEITLIFDQLYTILTTNLILMINICSKLMEHFHHISVATFCCIYQWGLSNLKLRTTLTCYYTKLDMLSYSKLTKLQYWTIERSSMQMYWECDKWYSKSENIEG